MTDSTRGRSPARPDADYPTAERLAQVGHYAWSADPETLFWSPQLYRLLGLPPDTPVDRHTYSHLVHPEDRPLVADQTQQILAGDIDGYTYDARIIRADDQRMRHVRVSGAVTRDARGCAVRVVGVLQDVTRRKARERALRVTERHLARANRLEALGRLAGGVAHDFNNLLTVILSNAVFVADVLPAGHEAHDDITALLAAAEQAGALTRELLTFAAPPMSSRTTCRPDAVLVEQRALLARVAGDERLLSVVGRVGPFAVEMAADRFQQLLVQLITNARQATTPGGRITVEARHVDDGAWLAVTDDGHGMTADVQSHAFEPFFTTRTGLTGLGLSTCHGLVQSAGGRILLTSAPGGGTRVEVWLPCTRAASRPSPTFVDAGCPPSTILLVDDNHALRAATRRVLTAGGHTVIDFGEPEAALAHFVAHEAEPIDVVITDVIMPGLSGPELARALRAQWPELPVLFMTGHPRDALATMADMPRVPLLTKPFRPATLLRALAETVSGPKA